MAETTQSRTLTRFETLRKRLNSFILPLAGRRLIYLTVIEHKGRRSGSIYSTPVAATKTRDGFVIPLAYGENVDWNRNILAAGGCTIRKDGRAYKMGSPQVIDKKDALVLMPPVRRLLSQVLPTQKYLHVRKVKTS